MMVHPEHSSKRHVRLWNEPSACTGLLGHAEPSLPFYAMPLWHDRYLQGLILKLFCGCDFVCKTVFTPVGRTGVVKILFYTWKSIYARMQLCPLVAHISAASVTPHREVVLPSPLSPCICNPRWSLEAPEGLQEWKNGRSAIDGGGGSALLPFSVPRWWHLGLGLWF